MVNTEQPKLLRIGQLSKRTGVSTSAINYYIREGLLPRPLKTAANMAYYHPGYVDMINSIKVLQRDRGLSLKEIRELLEQEKVSWSEDASAGGLSGAEKTGETWSLDRRRQIMDSAARVFAEKGYYASTIMDLASAAGVAKGTIYWYFNNKRDIMMAILDDINREINETFGAVIREAPDGLEAILRCVEPAVRLLEKHGPIYLMYFLEIGSTDPVLQKRYRDIYRVVRSGTKLALERGMREGVVRELNADLAAYAVMGLVERISQITGSSGEGAPVEERAREAVELLRHALASDRSG